MWVSKYPIPWDVPDANVLLGVNLNHGPAHPLDQDVFKHLGALAAEIFVVAHKPNRVRAGVSRLVVHRCAWVSPRVCTPLLLNALKAVDLRLYPVPDRHFLPASCQCLNLLLGRLVPVIRSEERRVGKECRSGWSSDR